MEEQLKDKFEYYKEMGWMTTNSMHPSLAEMLLDKKGSLDVHFLRESAGVVFSEKYVEKTFMSVFDATFLPKKFSHLPCETSITKEFFLDKIYEPAKYKNVRDFIEDVMSFYSESLTREDLFEWILSTAKTKVFLGDLQ